MTLALHVPPSAIAEAERLHAAGVEATALGHPAEAARHLRRALRLLGVAFPARRNTASTASTTSTTCATPESAPSPARDALAAKLLTSLAHAESEQGRTALGFALLTRCEPLVAPADRGTFHGQRGLLLLRTGKARAAQIGRASCRERV